MARYKFILFFLLPTLALGQTNSFKWIQQSTYTASGTNTYTATISGLQLYPVDLEIKIKFTNGNTGASTLAISNGVSSLGTIALQKNGSSLSSGDILPGSTYRISYDGSNFQVLGIGSSGGGSGTVSSVSVATANGFSGTVSNPTTTPAITLSLQDANGSQSGRLTSTDWNTFNGKANVLILVPNATDANFTATLNGVHNILDGVATANRVITIPAGSNGDVIEIYNTEDTYTWSFTGATVYLADRVTVQTALLYNVPCFMKKIDGRWIITD